MPYNTIDNQQDVLDSRDVIKYFEELESEIIDAYNEQSREAVDDGEWDDVDDINDSGLQHWLGEGNHSEAWEEYQDLKKLISEAEGSPDWTYGESLIRDDYFTEYTKQLIQDCYELPKEMESGNWPWRHLEMNWEGAAEEAKVDYIDCNFGGEIYWIRG